MVTQPATSAPIGVLVPIVPIGKFAPHRAAALKYARIASRRLRQKLAIAAKAATDDECIGRIGNAAKLASKISLALENASV